MAAFGACILPRQQREIKIWLRSHQAKRRILDMLVTKKMLIVLTLVGALVGAGIGSLITHSASSTSAVNNQNSTTTGTYPANYTSTSRTSGRRYYGSRRSYYDYSSAPRGRTFWQKHRDKLTVAMGTGGGALLGGLIGGKRGAGIGALAGAGGSALYTYKLRKRSRRY